MKFSIRDLLLVTVIVALAVGWWLDGSRLKFEIRYLQAVQRGVPEEGPLPISDY